MWYVMKVRLASFFAEAATASFRGMYILYTNYKRAHQSISHQVKVTAESLERRISALEELKESEARQPQEATD